MKWLVYVAAGLSIPTLLTLGVGAIYSKGYDSAQSQCQGQLDSLQASYDRAAIEAQNTHQTALLEALKKGQQASRDYMATERALAEQNQRLKDKLHEAAANTACVLDANWLRHYRAALGVPATHTDGADPARRADDATASATELLRHAIDYGQWCQANTAQLRALQGFLKEGKIEK